MQSPRHATGDRHAQPSGWRRRRPSGWTALSRTHWLIVGLIALCLSVAGCRKGPGKDELSQAVQQKIDERFDVGTFDVKSLTRKGSYGYQEEGDPRDRLLVYWDAEIRFLADHKLSDWDQPNVGSLTTLLGATPKGVDGVVPAGNKQGDVLKVHGSSAYARDGERWDPVAYAPSKTKPAASSPQGPDPEKQAPYQLELAELAKVGSELRRRGESTALGRFETDLNRLLNDSQRRLAQSRGALTLATGQLKGEYATLGGELERLLSTKARPARAFATSGSAENCQLVNRGEVGFAFAQNDIAAMAHGGTELFAGQPPLRRIRALCTLYPEAVQIVTLASSSIKSLADLDGKRVDIGLAGSGARINAHQLIEAAELSLADFASVQGKGPTDAAADLAAGRIDGFFFTSAYPAPAVAGLAAKKPVRLVSLEPAVIETLKKTHSFFIPIHIPAGTYPGVAAPCATVAVTAMLIARDDTPADRVEHLLTTLFAEVPKLATHTLAGYYISPKKALTAISIPLHPAAEQFFKQP